MIPKALRSFIQKLRFATENGELAWNEADALAYFCDHKDHTLHISSHFNEDIGQSSYFFRLVSKGKTTPFSVRDEEEDYAMMRDLFEAVIANANDVGSDIDDFFE